MRSAMKSPRELAITHVMLCSVCVLTMTVTASAANLNQLDETAVAQGASLVAQQISAQEWLGPLSAVALSPFFGLACLSGAATYGPDWLQSRSALLGASSPLNNPMLFWCMLGLTLATSLPRFTKVSKPIALAAEKLEAYSAVIILIAMKFLNNPINPSEPSIAVGPEFVLAAGILSVPVEVLLSVLAAINIIVVNTIKLAIELLVWLIPIPTIDAMLEVANKSICASLMALYAFSPWLSLLLNLAIFGACCFVFAKAKRQMRYVTEIYLLPVLEQLFFIQHEETGEVVGFLSENWNGLPAKSKFLIRRESPEQNEIVFESVGWFTRVQFSGKPVPDESLSGMLVDQISLQCEHGKAKFDVRRGSAKLTGTTVVSTAV
jgi:hypothetical protein